MKVLNVIALIIVIIGAINWGLIALFNLDLVALIFGTLTVFTRIVYGIVGLAGLWCLTLFSRLDE